MRPVFVGNLEYDVRQPELERLFGHYGKVERVDIKSGYGFVYFEDEQDAEDAIRKLDNYPFGHEKRRLSVEWGKGERGKNRNDGKANSNQKPTKTLFVSNFDPVRTKEHDIEKHFEPYGKVINVRIRRNFSFVQFATLEDATKALEATRRSKILDRVISIEYALKDDNERDDRYGGGSPRRSLSPVYRRRPSPDYGRPRSPEYDRYKGPAAHERRRSPAAHERRRSPAAHERRKSPAAYEPRKSPPPYERRRSPPPYEPRRSPPPYEPRRSPPPYERRRSPDYGRRSSDYGRQRSPAHDRHRSRSPVPRERR